MLLQRLKEYAESGRVENLAPAGYKETPVRYLIYLDENGRFIECVDQVQGGKGREKRGKLTIAPHVGRAYAIRPKLLVDNGEYALGIARDPAKQARVDESHRTFVDLTRTCATETGEAAVGAVLALLEAEPHIEDRLPSDFDPSAVVTFAVISGDDEVRPIDLPSVRTFWARRSGVKGDEGTQEGGDLEGSDTAGVANGNLMQCLVCGEVRPAVQRLAYKWQGIPGGQTSGLALISANAPAFESYGLEASLIAPTCAECGELFSKAANDLLASDTTRVRIGPLAYTFWTREKTSFNWATYFTDPRPGEVKALLTAAQRGQRAATEMDPERQVRFYAAAFSASGARVVVRDWLDTTVGEAQQHLARYFALQEIVDWNGAEGSPLPLWHLAAATVRVRKDPPAPQVPKALFSLALKGSQLPEWLLFEAVRRCRAAGGVYRERAALIKMVLLDGWEREEGRGSMTASDLVQLDPANRDPAYLCGRLLAVLEAIQREALGDISASIVDRFFGTASSAPASVFGRLLRGAQPHLKTLSRDKRGMYNIFENRLLDVTQGISGRDGFPKTLSLEKQGLFALGYYHQRAADRAERIARASRRRAANEGTPTDGAAQPD